MHSRELEILKRLKLHYPNATTALEHSNPFELLIATILSAQCTDERVNMVTKSLFEKYKTPEDYIKVPIEILEKEIYSTGFYKQKAKSIKKCCEILSEKFKGEVPKDLNELTTLPGVGRKTASVVAGACFNVPAIPVDTHVKRLSVLLGLTKSKNPDAIEEDLKKIFPEEDWFFLSNALIFHGRKICNARTPKCEICFLNDICPSYKEVSQNKKKSKK